jgi:hypothetical protein
MQHVLKSALAYAPGLRFKRAFEHTTPQQLDLHGVYDVFDCKRLD